MLYLAFCEYWSGRDDSIMVQLNLKKEAGRHTLYLEARRIGADYLVSIYGGDDYHIGGVAAGYQTQSHYREALTTSVSTIALPGHKDYIIANFAAEKLCESLNVPVIVTAGIHYDNATKAEITEIIDVVEDLVEEMIRHYQKAE